MARLKKILEIMALPLVLVVGYALTAMILLLVAAAVSVYLGWLIALNIEGPNGFVIAMAIITLVGLVLTLLARRARFGAAGIWKQLSRNL